MTTRREFVKAAAIAPFAGLTLTQSLADAVTGTGAGVPSEEPIYAGRPLSYWLARLSDRTHDRELADIADQWIFRHFGDVAVPGLIQAMKCEAWFHGESELEMIGTPATVRALAQAVRDADVRVRRGAISALYGIGIYKTRNQPTLRPAFREAVPILKEVLKTDPEEEVGRIAAWILFGIGSWIRTKVDPPTNPSQFASPAVWAAVVRRYSKHLTVDKVVPELVRLLDHTDPTTRVKAAEALSRFDPEHPGIMPIFVHHVVSQEAICSPSFHNLERIVPKALPALHEHFRNGSTKVKVSILHALAWSQSGVILPILAEGLVDTAWTVRAQAVSGLSVIDPREAVPLLIQALQDSLRAVRNEARWVLAGNERLAERALPEIIRLLNHETSAARVSAALALLDLEKEIERAAVTLEPSLTDKDPSIRVEAAISLSKVTPGRCELAHLLADGVEMEDHRLRNEAIVALRRLGEHSSVVLPRLAAGIRQYHYSDGRVFGYFSDLGPLAAPAAPQLMKLLADREHGRDAPLVLGKIGAKVLPLLAGALESGDVLEQSRAIRTLGYVGQPAESFIPILIERLDSPSPVIRIATAEALGRMGSLGISAVPALMELAEHPDIGVRVHAEQAIAQIQKATVA